MSGLALQFRDGAVFFPQLNLWLDAHEPQPSLVFVSHAHSDHVAAHREVILSEPTARLMQARLPGERREHVLRFKESQNFSAGSDPFSITLLPAGHIFGSAMALVEAHGDKVLYTGDFKLRRGLSAEACEPAPADVLVMETTFGRPQYRFPPAQDVLRAVVRFCREALDNDETPVLFGYSLGKSQELLCGLGDGGLPIMLHGAVWRLSEIYKSFGQCFPAYERYEAGAVRGKVLLCPPNVINSAMLRKMGRVRTAILTGWAVDPNCRYRYQCDAAFVLSDHADFAELIEMVKRVQPRLVYTLHGFAADFARTLRDLGFDARPLSEDEQLGLALPSGPAILPAGHPLVERRSAASAPNEPCASADLFAAFAGTCASIAKVSSKLEKIRLLSDYLKCLRGPGLRSVTTWFTGRPFPATQNRVMQLGWAVIRDAVSSVLGTDEPTFHAVYLKHSDLGETIAELLRNQNSGGVLSVESVEDLFEKLQMARGPLAKTPLLAGALQNCSPLEGRYLIKVLTGDLRIGLKEGLVEQAVALAFGRDEEAVRNAALLVGDLGEVAELAAEDRLRDAKLTPFRPVRFMLASPEPTAAAVWDRMRERQKEADGGTQTADATLTVWLEDKYDGIRCQLHKVGRRVELYSRDLKEVTTTFLELADSMRALPEDLVLDGEIVAMRGEQVLPFAELQRRLGRKQGDLFMRDEVPVTFVTFDLLWTRGETLLNDPLRQRRKRLEAIKPLPACLRLARLTPASSATAIDDAFDAARQRGNEGLMIKDPDSPYTPGRRGLAWLKLKKALATLDCVVIGAEYGHGKRNNVLSDYTFAVRNDETGELATIGKAYTGLTDAEIAGLTEHFLRSARRRHGRYFEVPPDTILEIAFDRLQPSNRHSSGLAMRFPRIVRIRKDKSLAEIDTIASARRLVQEPDASVPDSS